MNVIAAATIQRSIRAFTTEKCRHRRRMNIMTRPVEQARLRDFSVDGIIPLLSNPIILKRISKL